MAKIALIILTHNEENNIDQVLKSVGGSWLQQMVNRYENLIRFWVAR